MASLRPFPRSRRRNATLFANPAGLNAWQPALPAAPMAKPPIVAADDGEDDAPAANAPCRRVDRRLSDAANRNAAAFAPNPAALPVNAQPTQGQLPVAAAPSVGDQANDRFSEFPKRFTT